MWPCALQALKISAAGCRRLAGKEVPAGDTPEPSAPPGGVDSAHGTVLYPLKGTEGDLQGLPWRQSVPEKG